MLLVWFLSVAFAWLFIYCFMVERSEARRCSTFYSLNLWRFCFIYFYASCWLRYCWVWTALELSRRFLDFCGNIRIFSVLISDCIIFYILSYFISYYLLSLLYYIILLYCIILYFILYYYIYYTIYHLIIITLYSRDYIITYYYIIIILLYYYTAILIILLLLYHDLNFAHASQTLRSLDISCWISPMRLRLYAVWIFLVEFCMCDSDFMEVWIFLVEFCTCVSDFAVWIFLVEFCTCDSDFAQCGYFLLNFARASLTLRSLDIFCWILHVRLRLCAVWIFLAEFCTCDSDFAQSGYFLWNFARVTLTSW